jgi:predicted secreted protein
MAYSTLAALAVGLALQPVAARAADEDKLAGVFTNTVDGYKETWTIKYEDGKWSVSGVYQKPKTKDGLFEGKDVKFEGGKLIFTQKLYNASPTWIDNCTVTVETAGGGNLSYVWQVGEQKGAARTLTRTGPAPTPAPKPAGPDARLVGVFINNVDGFKETWTITQADGKWTVSGVYTKPRTRPGSFMGEDVKLVDGKLVFVQRLKDVSTSWIDGSTITVSYKDDRSLSYVWEVGNVKGAARTLTRTDSTTPARPAGAEDLFVGTFTTTTDGYHEHWTIRYADGKWDVSGTFTKFRTKPGSFTGHDVKLVDGKLVFRQRLTDGPAGWIDGSKITVEIRDEKTMNYVWEVLGQKGEPRILTRR